MPTLVLIDGHSIAYRAFFALPEDLATTSGQVTNAAYGFTRMLIRLLADHHPDGIAVAWDVSRQTFRSEQYPDYKANRTTAPDTFKSQLPLIRDVLDTPRGAPDPDGGVRGRRRDRHGGRGSRRRTAGGCWR
jgi:DNA polymerase I